MKTLVLPPFAAADAVAASQRTAPPPNATFESELKTRLADARDRRRSTIDEAPPPDAPTQPADRPERPADPIHADSGTPTRDQSSSQDDRSTSPAPTDPSDAREGRTTVAQAADRSTSGTIESAQTGSNASNVATTSTQIPGVTGVVLDETVVLPNPTPVETVTDPSAPRQVTPSSQTPIPTAPVETNASRPESGEPQAHTTTTPGRNAIEKITPQATQANEATAQAKQTLPVQTSDVATRTPAATAAQEATDASRPLRRDAPARTPESSLEPLRAAIIEDAQTIGESTSQSPSGDTNDSPERSNPATELARALVELANRESDRPPSPLVEPIATAPEPAAPVSTPSLSPVSPGAATQPNPSVAPTQATSGPTVSTLTTDVQGAESDSNIENVVKLVSGSASARHAHVRLQLQPPELGQMQIDVRTRQQVLTLRIEVQNEAALARIQSGAAQLKQALEQHGLVLDRFDVHVRATEPTSSRSDAGDNADPRFADSTPTFDREHRQAGSSHASEGGGSDLAPGDDGEAAFDEPSDTTDDGRRRVLTASSVDLWA